MPTKTPALSRSRPADGDAGPLHCLPRGFQQQPLLRVGGLGLTLGDAEERRVELGDVGEESGTVDVGWSGVFGFGSKTARRPGRSSGISLTTSRSPSRKSQYSSGELRPPAAAARWRRRQRRVRAASSSRIRALSCWTA